MKKRYLCWLLALCMVFALLPAAVFAAEGEDGEASEPVLQYTAFDNAVAITGVEGTLTGLVALPDAIDDQPVVEITNEAFAGCTELVGVVVPDSVKTIGARAFAGCTALKFVQLSSALTTLGEAAFADCTSLDGIVIPEGVKELNATFSGCTALRNITLSPTLERVYKNTLAGCENFKHIHFLGTNADIAALRVSTTGNEPFFVAKNYVLTDQTPDALYYFYDLPVRSDWSWDGINFCLASGIMTGTSTAGAQFPKFTPNGVTTRAQLVTILWRLTGEPAPTSEYGFTDLKDDWYRDAVNWAAENKIVNGTSAKKFSPNASLTREDMATIFYRYCTEFLGLNAQTEGSLEQFSDNAKVSGYAKTPVLWCVENGLINGTSKRAPKLAPASTTVRSQIAAVVYRFCELVASMDTAPVEDTDSADSTNPTDTETDVTDATETTETTDAA